MRTRVHLCPFLETDGTPLKNRFELFSLLKPADDLPLFWLDVLLLLAWIIPDCGESDAPFPLTNFAQPFNGKCSCDCSTQPPSFHFICVVHNFLKARRGRGIRWKLHHGLVSRATTVSISHYLSIEWTWLWSGKAILRTIFVSLLQSRIHKYYLIFIEPNLIIIMPSPLYVQNLMITLLKINLIVL